MNDDVTADACRPVNLDASGILHCLNFLAQHAATLKLYGTLSAIERALEAAAAERDIVERPSAPRLHAITH